MTYSVKGTICLLFVLFEGDNIQRDITFGDVSLKVAINSASNFTSFNISFAIDADSKEKAWEQSQKMLENIADKISFNRNNIVKEVKINEVADGVVTTYRKILTADAMIVEKVTEEEQEEMFNFMKKEISDENQEFLFDYRQAICQESKVTQFILLYRLLEKVCMQDVKDNEKGRIKTDEYLECFDPDCEKKLSGPNNNREVTVYTWIRDNIHYKKNSYPFPEIELCLPKFKEAVRGKIVEVIKITNN